MKKIALVILGFLSILGFSQKNPIGAFANERIEIKFNEDKTFEYKNKYRLNPAGHKTDSVYVEKGFWEIDGDTIKLNAQLKEKNYGNDELIETQVPNTSKILMKFNIIRSYFDKTGNLGSTDTLQIDRLDFAINSNVKKNISRITQSPTTRCAFAGYIPKELVTNERSFEFEKPSAKISKIFIGCQELGKMNEYTVKNPDSNSFTLNIYQNIYDDGMLRNKKFLMMTKNIILIEEKQNGKFKIGGIYYDYYQIKRIK